MVLTYNMIGVTFLRFQIYRTLIQFLDNRICNKEFKYLVLNAHAKKVVSGLQVYFYHVMVYIACSNKINSPYLG